MDVADCGDRANLAIGQLLRARRDIYAL